MNMMLSPIQKDIKNYLMFFRIGIKNAIYYKIALILEVFFTFFVIVFLFYFWNTLGDGGVSFVDSKFVFYIVLAFAIGNTLNLQWSFIQIIKSEGGTAVKDLTYLLVRNLSPISYDVKERAWSLVTFVLMLGFLFVFNAVVGFYDFDYWKLIPFIFFIVISYFLVSYLSLIVSYFAFWFDEAWAFGYATYMILGFASGSMLPIYIMPEWLQSILLALPFQYLAYIPTQILIEDFTVLEYIKMFAFGVFWVVVVGFINHLFYKFGLRKFESQGG